jgi:uncharacterized caspase-like protein
MDHSHRHPKSGIVVSQRLALIIGSSIFRDGTLSRLLSPDADVGSLADILLDPEIGGFDDVKLLVNMTSSTIRRTISEFFAKKKRDDLLLLYFSGHGVLDEHGRLYLAFKDTERQLLRGTAIPASFITDEMNNSRSRRQVLILDCCHSGAFARGTKGTPGAVVGTGPTFEGTGYGRVVLTASDATQYAFEGDHVIGDAENSVFTHYLIQGLQTGEADIDSDGTVTVDELYDYTYGRVVNQTPSQTPGKWSYKEQGEIVIAHNPQVEQMQTILPEMEILAEEIDEKFEQRLENFYVRGLSAYHLRELDKAIHYFQSIVDVRPDYQDAKEKLADSRAQADLLNLYNQARTATKNNNWKDAVTKLESLLKLTPFYEDAAAMLIDAKQQMQVTDLYEEAQHLAKAEQWHAILSVVIKIEAIDPDFGDPENLANLAREKIAESEREQKLRALYRRALNEIDTEQWKNAQGTLEEVQAIEQAYEETPRLLAIVRAEIQKEAEAQIQAATAVPPADGQPELKEKQPEKPPTKLEAKPAEPAHVGRVGQIQTSADEALKEGASQEVWGTFIGDIQQVAGQGSFRFIGMWLVTHMAGWMIGSMLWYFGLTIGGLGSFLEGLFFGTAIGLAQWIILRQFYGQSGRWIIANIVAFGVGFPLFSPFGIWDSPVLNVIQNNLGFVEQIAKIITIFLTGAFIGFALWIVLREDRPNTAWFVPIMMVGWFISEQGGQLTANLTSFIHQWQEPLLATFEWIGHGVTYGVILGLTLVWLISQNPINSEASTRTSV